MERVARRAGVREPVHYSVPSGGRTLLPIPKSWVSETPLGSSLAFQLQRPKMRLALGGDRA